MVFTITTIVVLGSRENEVVTFAFDLNLTTGFFNGVDKYLYILYIHIQQATDLHFLVCQILDNFRDSLHLQYRYF